PHRSLRCARLRGARLVGRHRQALVPGAGDAAMTAVAARTLSARRSGRRLARPVRQVRRPPAGARRTKRRWRLVLLAAAAVLVVWALWPGAPERDQPSVSGPSKAAATPGAATPDDAPTATPASMAPSHRLRPAQRP